MKKVLFLQINSKSFGGIWNVNKTLGDAFLKKGYDVEMLAIRQNKTDIKEISNFKVETIDLKREWKFLRKRDLISSITKGPVKFFKNLKKYFFDKYYLNQDYKKMKRKILEINPDYIIASHYQTLPGIPKKYLKRTVNVQHSSFQFIKEDKKNLFVLHKYEKKLFCLMWLSSSILQRAIEYGYKKNRFIYNPIKIMPQNNINIKGNKKLIVITRISNEKRIDLMIEIVNDVFKDEKYSNWVFEIYGTGTFNDESNKVLKESKQISYKGITNNVKDILIASSINLNTSLYEGFSLSIIEAYACGVPTVSFNFGESCKEEIIDGKTGYIIENNNIEEYKNKLKSLMDDENKLSKFSSNSLDFSKKFDLNKIVDQWINIFNEIDISDKGEVEDAK